VTFLQLNELELVGDLWMEENITEVITLMMADFIKRQMLSKLHKCFLLNYCFILFDLIC